MKCLVFFNTLYLLVCIPAFSQRQYSTYQKDGYVGLEFVETHTQITLPIYEKITPCPNVQRTNKKSYLDHGLYWPTHLSNNIELWKVVKDGKCGLINKEGASIVPIRYDDIQYLIDTSYAVISEAGKTGLIDINGTVIIPPAYIKILYVQNSDELFIVQTNTERDFSVINKHGKILSTFSFPTPISRTLRLSIQENNIILANTYSWLKGAYDLYGQEIITQVYDELDFAFGVFSFKKEDEVGLMDLTGKRIFSRSAANIFHITPDRSMIDVGHYTYQLVDNAGNALGTDTFSMVSVHPDFMIVKVKSTGKYGVLNFDGKMIIPATYQSLSLWNGILIAKKEDKYGIINTSGNTVLPFKYQNAIISSPDIPYLLLKQKGKYGCIDNQLHEVMPYKYQQLQSVYYANGNTGSPEAVRIVSIKGATKGVIDLHGNVKLPYQETTFIRKKNETYEKNFRPNFPSRSVYFNFEKITNPIDKRLDCIVLDDKMHEITRCYSRLLHEYNDFFLLAQIDRKWGMIAADGVTVIPFIYNELYPLGNTHFIAKKDRHAGVLNRSGDIRIAFQYSNLGYFSDEYIIAYDTNSSPKCGLIDYTGKTKIPFLYQSLYSEKRFQTNLLIAKKDSLFGLIDLNAKEIIPFEYEYIQQFDTTLFLVKKDGKQGIVSIDNKIILPIVYDDVFYMYMNEHIFHVKNNNKHGVVNSANKIIIPIIYDDLFEINKNMFQVKNNGLYGIVNNVNQLIIPVAYTEISYDNISMHSNDQTVQVQKADKIGIMHINGTTILPVEFNSIVSYDTICRVSKDSMYYFAHGLTVNYKEAYEEIYSLANIFRVKKNGKYGASNYKGDVLIEPVYDEVDYFPSRGIVVKKDGKEATFDIYGKMIVPLH